MAKKMIETLKILPKRRISLAIFIKDTAKVLRVPLASTSAS